MQIFFLSFSAHGTFARTVFLKAWSSGLERTYANSQYYYCFTTTKRENLQHRFNSILLFVSIQPHNLGLHLTIDLLIEN